VQVHHHRRGVYVDDVDGATWLRVPPAVVSYTSGTGRLTIECAAVMAQEQVTTDRSAPLDHPLLRTIA